jgi:hypothetical protein
MALDGRVNLVLAVSTGRYRKTPPQGGTLDDSVGDRSTQKAVHALLSP